MTARSIITLLAPFCKPFLEICEKSFSKGLNPLSQSLAALPAPPRGEPTHLQGQQQQKGKLSLPYNLSVIIAPLDATSPSRGGLGRRFVFRLIRLRLQNHHLPQGKDFAPAGQTGAKRQTPKTRRPAKGSPTRGAVTAKPVTERFNPDAVELCETERAPKTFFKKS